MFIHRCIEKLPICCTKQIEFKENGNIEWPYPYEKFIHDESVNKTIFIFPPALDGGEVYFKIVHKFSPLNVILFNNYPIDYKHQNNRNCDITIEELAKLYIHYMKELDVDEPYTLMGWSFGGVLALEIAKQLLDDGKSVKNLIIIDSYFNLGMHNEHDM